MPIFPIEEGRIGLLICYDMWFPEVFRYYSSQGVGLVCIPTNWVPEKNQPINLPDMANQIAMVNAHCNSLFIACADRVGVERDQPFVGRSIIVDPNGWPVAGPASDNKEEILFASINLSNARQERSKGKLNNTLYDRRDDLLVKQGDGS